MRLQFALSIREIATTEADAAIARVLHDSGDVRLIRDAAVTGMRARELEFGAGDDGEEDEPWAGGGNGRSSG